MCITDLEKICFFLFWFGVGAVGDGGGGGRKSHFLMLSRRAAVLYCVA